MKRILFFILICFTVNTITAKDNKALIKEAIQFLQKNSPKEFIEKYACETSNEIEKMEEDAIKRIELAKEKGEDVEGRMEIDEKAAAFLKDYLNKIKLNTIKIVSPEEHKTHNKFLGDQYYTIYLSEFSNTGIHFHVEEGCIKVTIYIFKDNDITYLGYIGH